MVDSELYEDAQSKIESRSKSNTVSIYQDAQSKLKNYNKNSKQFLTKKSDSSVYQDAQSHITNNSRLNAPKNSTSKINQGKNEIKYKNDFLKVKNIYKSENMINNEEEEEKYLGRNRRYENYEDEIDNNEEMKSGSIYEEPKGGESGEIEKKATIFEGITKKGGECCNLPKCYIF